jgi:hypothetical protein
MWQSADARRESVIDCADVADETSTSLLLSWDVALSGATFAANAKKALVAMR